jgi:adenylosuccinate lyase
MKFTKTAFRAALKANDQTKVWHLAAIKMGRTPTRHEVYTMVKEISNSQRDAGRAFSIAYGSSRKDAQRKAIDEAWMRRGAYRQNDGRADALDMLRRLLTENCGNYTKVPMLGHTHLYFCHPGYGHADYNKVRTCAIEGNEEFVNKIVKIGEKFMAKHKI